MDIKKGMKQREITRKYHVRSSVVTAIRKMGLHQDEGLPLVRSVGEMAKLAFTEFVCGKTPADVLMKYSFDLALIERLYEDYKVMKGPLLECKRCREDGESDGVDEALHKMVGIDFFYYPCRYCGQDMRWYLGDSKQRNQLSDMLVKGGIRGWAHSDCNP